MADKLVCADRGCQWNTHGKCILFRGISMLECKYRKTYRQLSLPFPVSKTTKTKKKG